MNNGGERGKNEKPENRYGKNARFCAVAALTDGEKNRAYSDANIACILREAGLDKKDSALASVLYYGVLQNMLYIDRCLAEFSSLKLKKVHPRVLNILRVGVYQLLFTDKIPASAAVNESVKLAGETGNRAAAGYVNALLRKISISKNALEGILKPDADDYLSVKYSHPQELVRLLRKALEGLALEGLALTGLALPDLDLEALLKANNETPPICARVNRLKADRDGLFDVLGDESRELRADADVRDCFYIRGLGNITQTQAYKDGLFSVQDKASMLSVLALDPRPGELIIDGCAAPGGKSLYAAELTGNAAKILSFDKYEGKLGQIRENARRLGVTCVEARLVDALTPLREYFGRADRVIADVPCSGLGIIRKKPDIRYKDPARFALLPELQLKILSSLSKYVKPGGTLVYSTCTVLPAENEGVAREFLNENSGFELRGFFEAMGGGLAAPEGMKTLFPHIHGTDGFFICKMRRIE